MAIDQQLTNLVDYGFESGRGKPNIPLAEIATNAELLLLAR